MPISMIQTRALIHKLLRWWILPRLSIFSIMKVLCLRPSLRPLLKAHMRDHIEARLAQYVSDPWALRQVMRRSGTVISGSTTLHLILGKPAWDSKDIDFYTRRGYTHYIASFLLRDGYRCIWPAYRDPASALHSSPPGYRDMIGDQYVHRILKFEKEDSDGRVISVDIIESTTASAIAPVTEFHCTALMNCISADSIICMYPKLTAAGLAVTQDRHAKDRDAWMNKYTRRGFRILTSTDKLGHGCGSACPAIVRTLADPDCLYFIFDQHESTGTPFSGTESPKDLGWPTLHWTLGKSRLRYNRLCPNRFCARDVHDPLMTVYPESFACVTHDFAL
ncbi:hypothetical protein M422DRAFT_43558 [Sphaerobolus stellatus SS14]|nr:hypothetical protein M422DRAFT_43558 [Sphaerobolus stellatus SS14]